MPLVLRSMTVAGYRSLRAISLPAQPLNVLVGENGVGKTNLYRALQLVQAAANGRLAHELAAEGGMEKVAWAGRRVAGKPVRIRLAVELAAPGTEHAWSYEVAVGLPTPTSAAFPLEPQVKEELASFHGGPRPLRLMERKGRHLTLRDAAGRRSEPELDLLASETALASIAEPERHPDLELIRSTLLDWRFYHELRTDRGSPLRRPCLAVTSPALDSDGGNLGAVLATLAHVRGDTVDLDAAIADAFAGARLVVPVPGRQASFGLFQPDHPQRLFEAEELSDGTLRFIALAGALLAYRPPGLIALNEPETSLHPDLLEPLARLILRASARTSIWLVTHSQVLAAALARLGNVQPRRVVKEGGATWVAGLMLGGGFRQEEEP